MKKILSTLIIAMVCVALHAQTIRVVTQKNASNRELYAKEYLEKKLKAMGCQVSDKKARHTITLLNSRSGAPEGYTIRRDKNGLTVSGNDASGVIYGCVELAHPIRRIAQHARRLKRGRVGTKHFGRRLHYGTYRLSHLSICLNVIRRTLKGA